MLSAIVLLAGCASTIPEASRESAPYSSRPSTYVVQDGRHGSTKAVGVERDRHGRIARSSLAKEKFMRETGYPHGRPGYVVDHVIPLSKGGRDDPSNMQWQTIADAKAKDKWERGQSSQKSTSSYRRSHSHKRAVARSHSTSKGSGTRSHRR
jgi:hypothetical protein